ncbi:MAG: hypothetical protein JRJ57_04545 [Deltaproteobacteria bacterium]|nr:hypothetical protein [Deltaproteobacteria bacterium]
MGKDQPLVGGDKGEGAPSPQPSPLSACGHAQAGIKGEGSPLSACGHAQAGIKGEGVFWQFVNFWSK